jgi:hypothetical protein
VLDSHESKLDFWIFNKSKVKFCMQKEIIWFERKLRITQSGQDVWFPVQSVGPVNEEERNKNGREFSSK